MGVKKKSLEGGEEGETGHFSNSLALKKGRTLHIVFSED